VFAAWFRVRRAGLRMLIGGMVATLLPLAYDPHALAGPQLASTIILMMILPVVGGTIIAARGRLEAVRDQARADSLRDPLTGLANRRALDAEFRGLGHSRRDGDRLGVVLIDLDGFKQINTDHGHAGGDRALVAVAGALREAVRERDLVARIGGDEFAIVAADVDARTLSALAQRAVEGIGGAGRALGLDGISLGASAGAAVFPEDGRTAVDLLRAADVALSAAKRDGKGRIELAA
jgi:diguanylate cyclase (GGDEF)-like protein